MSRSYIITGASGYIGRRLVKVLKDHKSHIYELGKDSNGVYQWENESYLHSIFQSAVERNSSVKVIHIATKYEPEPSYSEQMKANILLPMKMIEFAIAYNIKHFINVDSFFTNTSTPNKYLRLPSYVLSKAQIKEWFIFFNQNINIINCKIFHTYGPNDKKSKFVNGLIDKLSNNDKNIELSSCETVRDFIYIDDVISALKIISENDTMSYLDYEIGTGIGTSVREFSEEAKNILNSNAKLNFGESSIHGDLGIQIADINKLEELGWKPKYNIYDGIKEFAEFINVK